MSKIITGAIAAAAYVLGAKAGRERYDQIQTKVRELWSDPRVQAKKFEATRQVKDRSGQVAGKLPGNLGGSTGKHTPDAADSAGPDDL
ncbi:hypothetical protein GCM10011492_27690 [Flexivirga endophytica]|uniref:YtxH domain-containing protein n=1 Tax=Flexivirga endophytica TaxID=1849103 RepID=A0A916WWI3_9MICO|nr:YtxH domain-containing protein [Flexivirga endophytica]GGB35513.1 hypothetical protein GCM10011492_27690 [Flexivirga endophytica]GHB43226.1 hypothetical protein GCM10008112_10070 [Flexivirga endophytica]